MMERFTLVTTCRTVADALRMFEEYGDFHDAGLDSVRLAFGASTVDLVIDNLFSGVDGHARTRGGLRFTGIDFLLCRLPFVGGRVRIDSLKVRDLPGGIETHWYVSQTECLHTPDFSVSELVIVASAIELFSE